MGDNFVKRSTPSDIVFAGTIPLMDCIIEIDERGWAENGKLIRYRVVIFDDVIKGISNTLEKWKDSQAIIGAIIPLDPYVSKLFEFTLMVTAVAYDGIGIHVQPKNEAGERFIKQYGKEPLRDVYGWLHTWYGVQIALLHPDVKEVFKCPTRLIANAGSGKGERKRKVKYIRKHILTLSNLEKAAHSDEARKFNRRCLVWYVIGHWREYPSGRKVFIKPYWKGPLRQTKRNADGDDRIRII